MAEVPSINQNPFPSQDQLQLPNPCFKIPFHVRIRKDCENNILCVSHSSVRTCQSNAVGDASPVCGLAALNCARAILCQERTDNNGMDLLAKILSKELALEIIAPCPLWTSKSYLGISELLGLPVFSRTLQYTKSPPVSATLANIRSLLDNLYVDQWTSHSAALVIEQPYRVTTCIKLRTFHVTWRETFIIFDYMPRRRHPLGAGFYLTDSIEWATTRLFKQVTYDFSNSLLLLETNVHTFTAFTFVAQQGYAKPLDEFGRKLLDYSISNLAMQRKIEELKRGNVDSLGDSFQDLFPAFV